jgi:hypothetical protein
VNAGGRRCPATSPSSPAVRPGASARRASNGATYALGFPTNSASACANSLKRRATLFTLLLSAFEVLLARYAGENDIVVGSPMTGRTRPGCRTSSATA